MFKLFGSFAGMVDADITPLRAKKHARLRLKRVDLVCAVLESTCVDLWIATTCWRKSRDDGERVLELESKAD